MSRTVLDQIDTVLADTSVGPDAVRYVPAAPDANALALHCDGTLTPVVLPGDATGNLHALRAAIGCDFVDVVTLADDLDMWLDDEGIYRQPHNVYATALAQLHGRTWQPYHGTVVLTGGCDENGDTLPLSEELATRLRELLDGS
ncbi:DUF3846 domain-containing protein [Streptomyces sp. NPDC006975]|uniref:DUF3846 domain-containing protein n=1 Tax=Streptomyces sp. NPDC006975 TaxID=3154310 RepID=UPI00345217F8